MRVRRAGFTLIEALVVVVVVGLLAALLLPAVQAAREASRRAHCGNNLRQIGVALGSYEATLGVLPPGGDTEGRTPGGFSFHVALLPYLGERALFHSINFDIPAYQASMSTPNGTAYSIQVSTFLCPSDAAAGLLSGVTSYAGNGGTGRTNVSYDGTFVPLTRSPLGLADFRDGTSRTAAVSESLLGLVGAPDDRRRYFFHLNPPPGFPLQDFEILFRYCRDHDEQAVISKDPGKGMGWVLGGYGISLYNHSLKLNAFTCIIQPYYPGVITASSEHPGGANVLFVDGHVSFVRETVGAPVWRALGSRNGGEAVDF